MKHLRKFNEGNSNLVTKDIKFDLCIGVEELINFIEQNSNYEWNDICDMELKYRKSMDFEDYNSYPIIELREYDESLDDDNKIFHKWCEKFIDAYATEIGNRTVYILHQ